MIHIPDSILPHNHHGQPLCPKCQRLVKSCICPTLEPERSKQPEEAAKPKVRLETSGRHGKTVTLIEGLTRDEHQLKELAKTLKTKTGSGGTHYIGEHGGVIEIQGDHKADVRKILEKRTT